jgi:hypothetical protein
MKNFLLVIIALPFIGLAQNFTVTKQPSYGLDPKYTPTTYTVKQTGAAISTNPVGDALNQVQQNLNAQRATSQVIDNQNRIEDERRQREKLEINRLKELEDRRIREDRKIQEEKNPNSILNKFKNLNLKEENDNLKDEVLQLKLLLSEKEKDLKKNSKNK